MLLPWLVLLDVDFDLSPPGVGGRDSPLDGGAEEPRDLLPPRDQGLLREKDSRLLLRDLEFSLLLNLGHSQCECP